MLLCYRLWIILMYWDKLCKWIFGNKESLNMNLLWDFGLVDREKVFL